MLFPFHSRISSEDANMRRGHTNERSVARSTGPQRSVSMSAQSGRKTWRTLGKSSNSTPLATKHSKVRASIKEEALYEKARVNWMILTTTCHNRLKTPRVYTSYHAAECRRKLAIGSPHLQRLFTIWNKTIFSTGFPTKSWICIIAWIIEVSLFDVFGSWHPFLFSLFSRWSLQKNTGTQDIESQQKTKLLSTVPKEQPLPCEDSGRRCISNLCVHNVFCFEQYQLNLIPLRWTTKPNKSLIRGKGF